MSGENQNPIKKTILVLSANPKGTNPVRLDEEIRDIDTALRLGTKREKFKIESARAVRYRDIQRSILTHKPQIVHFSGHGAGEPGLVIEDEIGQQKLVDAQALAGFFELFADKVECVVLNACYSQIQAKAIAKHIDYVIGMSKEIGDKAAIEFAVGFYDALGDGSEFEFAYKYGCSSIRMAGIAEHLTPQLLRKQDYSGDNIDTTPITTPLPPNTRQTIVVSPPPIQEESNIIEYRQKVEEFAADGIISDIESNILNHLQKKLGLTDEQAREVQKEVFEPLEIYKQQFFKKAAQAYPLGEKTQAELKKLQDYYKIKDEYINLLNREAEKLESEKLRQEEDKRLQQRKLEEAEYQRQQQEEERLRQQEQQRLESQRQQAEQKQQENKQSSPVSTPQSPSIIQIQPFEFETATLTVRSITQTRPRWMGLLGEETSTSTSCEINRSRRYAEYFQEDLGNDVFLEMVKIPGGTFLMGSPENDDESPQHQVNIQQFFMGKFPVTQEQYEAIMGENPSDFQGKNKPVESVSWDNAVDFCGRISKRTGKTYRLPSEAEWEYACRAGTTTPFHFGETITTDLANYNGNYTYGYAPKGQYREQTTDVGIFPANTFGLYDMHGNVYEWCQDSWHEDYQAAPKDGSAWMSDNKNNLRLLRGGSWFNFPRNCRCAFRGWGGRDSGLNNIGFRVVVAFPRAS